MNQPGRWKLLLLSLATSAVILAGCSSGPEDARSEAQSEARSDNPATAQNVQGEEQETVAPVAEPEEAASQDGPQGAVSGTWPVAEVAAAVEPSVVQVNVEAIQTTPFGAEEEVPGLGSGVIYREDGYIITNNHVVEGAEEVNIAFADGTVEQAEVVGNDAFTDLAVVQVDRDGLPAANFAENPDVRVGELAVAIGSPAGFQATVTSGVISGLNRDLPPELTGTGEGAAALVDLIQTDAAISPGNSGGALANEASEVIGINVAYLPPAQTGAVDIGFAIPSTTATSVADQLIETGEAQHPFLGVNITPLTSQIAEEYNLGVESGALVTNVNLNSPASSAGIEPGDVITAVGGEPVEDTGDVIGALRNYDPGESVGLTIVSGGEEQQVEVVLRSRN